MSQLYNTLSLSPGDIWKSEHVDHIESGIDRLYNYATPQMFGAKADGVTDDTIAVQAALDSGYNVYFPEGRYKVTSQLNALQPCKISMAKPYPCIWKSGGAGDMPQTADQYIMGARIETYVTGDDAIGFLCGDSIQIDGLYVRAMAGFTGTIFKFDGNYGTKTYPSQTRLKHIKVDTYGIEIVPQCMFDFHPVQAYFVLVDDIQIGGMRNRQNCHYGFKMQLEGWTNSTFLSNICIDAVTEYAFYMQGEQGCANFAIDNLVIQTFPKASYDKVTHKDVFTIKDMGFVSMSNCWLWDLHAANYERTVVLENAQIRCNGSCHQEFEFYDTRMQDKIDNALDLAEEAGRLNAKGLVSVEQTTVAGVGDENMLKFTLTDESVLEVPFKVGASTLEDVATTIVYSNGTSDPTYIKPEYGNMQLKSDGSTQGTSAMTTSKTYPIIKGATTLTMSNILVNTAYTHVTFFKEDGSIHSSIHGEAQSVRITKNIELPEDAASFCVGIQTQDTVGKFIIGYTTLGKPTVVNKSINGAIEGTKVGYYKAADGSFVGSSGYTSTPLIPIDGDAVAVTTYYRSAANGATLCFYDASESYIGCIKNPGTTGTYFLPKILPTKAKYITCSWMNNYVGSVGLFTLKFNPMSKGQTVRLSSPDGNTWQLQISNDGQLSAIKV